MDKNIQSGIIDNTLLIETLKDTQADLEDKLSYYKSKIASITEKIENLKSNIKKLE